MLAKLAWPPAGFSGSRWMLSWRSCPSSPSTGGDTTRVSSAVARLEERLSELAGAPVELERPNDPAHGDYATNVAMRLAAVQRWAPGGLGEGAGAGQRRRGGV